MRRKFKIGMLVLGDIFVLYLSLALTLLIRYQTLANIPLMREHILPFSILFVVWVTFLFIYNLYDITSAKNTLEFYTTFAKVIAINFAIAVFFFYFIPLFTITPKTNLFLFLLLFLIIFSLWRQFTNKTLKQRLSSNTIILGAGKRPLELAQTLNNNPQIGYRVVTVFTKNKHELDPSYRFKLKTTRSLHELAALAQHYDVKTLVIESNALRKERIAKSIYPLLENGIEIVDFDNFAEGLRRKVQLENIDEFWFLRHIAKGQQITYDFFKRILDILASIVILPIVLIISALASIAIKLDDGGPIFYKQVRVGEGGKPFTIIKFRTMREDAEKYGPQWTTKKDPRITKIGPFLRKTRFDEFPQLVNIFAGELSFVGPRAERPEFHDMLKEKIPFYENRYLIKPGLTGWAQINYTYGSSVEDTKEKLAYDLYYLKHRSLIFDIGIILKTVELVLSYRGR